MPALREQIYLIGYPQKQLVGSKLPSKGDCLKVLIYKLRFNKYTVKKSVDLVIRECLVFWQKAHIPFQNTDKSKKKLQQLYNDWKKLLKDKNRNSDIHQKRREEWKDSQNDLFDIAHNDALNRIKIQEDKDFLIMQRSKGRGGCIGGVDATLKKREDNRKRRKLREDLYRKKVLQGPSTSTAMVDISSGAESEHDISSNAENQDNDQDIFDNCDTQENVEISSKAHSQPNQRGEQILKTRARADFLTPRLAAVLDKLKVSSRDAVHLLSAVLEAVGLDSSDFVINRNSIRQQRDALRKHMSENLMENFSANVLPLTIHWDTKLCTGITGKEERLAIIATGPDINQILNMPAIPSGTGFEISSAVYNTLEANNVIDRTAAFVFDTTSSNTGKFKGACNLLEKKIGRDILFLGCRHHIFEIVLAAAFKEANVEITSGPEIVIFKNFKKHWPIIDPEQFLTVAAYSRLEDIICDQRCEILSFANEKILKDFPRNDYREFLELIIILLGGTPPRGIKFVKPGALHLARWMAKAIYCLKILIFQNQFPDVTDTQINGLVEFAGFVIKCYSLHWFDADRAEEAALNDVEFLRKLHNYKSINLSIAETAISKFQNHLYYLNEECVGFALFDERIPEDTKAKLVSKMNISITEEQSQDDNDSVSKKLIITQLSLGDFLSSNNYEILEKLFTRHTAQVFKRFSISTDFLKTDPSTWIENNEYKKGKYIVGNLKVVNDPAERGIKLIQDYHDKITKDEGQRQHLFKIIQHYTQQYSKEASLDSLKSNFR